MKIIINDCIAAMREMEENSIDAIVTDPPYGLEFMGKTWDKLDASDAAALENAADAGGFQDGAGGNPYSRGRVRHGKKASSVAMMQWHEEWAKEALRVLKPGGYMLVFGGSRTYHSMAMGVELAGFEIRDQIQWVYGSGFPKSHNVGKAIDKAAGAKREVVETRPVNGKLAEMSAKSATHPSGNKDNYWTGEILGGPITDAAKQWDGWGTALKPAHEPIVVARKPFKGTVAANVLEHGTGAINVDGCRVPGEKPDTTRGAGGQNGAYSPIEAQGRILDDGKGRWPANFIHDGSEEGLEQFPTSRGQQGAVSGKEPSSKTDGVYGEYSGRSKSTPRKDNGSAARFFYCAKPSKKEKNAGLEGFEEKQTTGGGGLGSEELGGKFGSIKAPQKNSHPTVKPVALMAYLCRLVTQPGGIVLDPFLGSGSTGVAALAEGFDFIGIEREAEYAAIAEARIVNAKE